MEERKEVLARTRSRICSVKNRKGKSWEDVFDQCDKDNSGFLDYNELEGAVRKSLGISDNVIRNYELKMLFQEMDGDESGGVSIEEFLDYVQQGHRTPEQVAAQAKVRIQRARKYFRIAFQGLSGNAINMRKLFAKLDIDGDHCLSLFEFTNFVRTKLNLSFWIVNNSDLVEFFKHLDGNGNGSVSFDELFSFVKNNQLQPKDFSFLPTIQQRDQVRGGCRMKTYKQRLLEDSVRSVSLPNLSRLPYTPSVVGLGRSAAPSGRNALRKSAQLFFNNGVTPLAHASLKLRCL